MASTAGASPDPGTTAMVVDDVANGSEAERTQAARADVQRFRDVTLDILRRSTCLDIIPDSGKVVVFDSELPIKHAFFGLVEHDIKCAPVWDSRTCDYSGMITVTDFNAILLHFYDSAEFRQSTDKFALKLGEYTVRQWNELKRGDTPLPRPKLFFTLPEDSLLDGVRVLVVRNIHRLPVMQLSPENVILCINNLQRILRFILHHIEARGQSSLLERIRVGDLPVGSFGDGCARISGSMTLIEVLKLLKRSRTPAVAIVDQQGRYVDAYSRSDVRYLAVDMTHDKFEKPIIDIVSMRENRMLTVTRRTTLDRMFSSLLSSRKHACIVLDDDRVVLGILSLSDVFQFFLENDLQPPNT
ncbi:CBS domain-containing protein [Plasmodiophora brassicae]